MLVGNFARLLDTACWMRPATRTASRGFCWCRTPRPRASGVPASPLAFRLSPRSCCVLCAPLRGACACYPASLKALPFNITAHTVPQCPIYIETRPLIEEEQSGFCSASYAIHAPAAVLHSWASYR